MSWLLGRKKAPVEGGEKAAYKKADLGEKNSMYYNEELKMWVEKGKEDEARAEKAKLSAPPPVVAAKGPAGGAPGADKPPPVNMSRPRGGLASRYVATAGLSKAAGGGGGSNGGSSAPLLPGMPPPAGAAGGGPKPFMPAIPTAGNGGGPPSFFIPSAPTSTDGADASSTTAAAADGEDGAAAAPGAGQGTNGAPSFFMPTPIKAAEEAASAPAATPFYTPAPAARFGEADTPVPYSNGDAAEGDGALAAQPSLAAAGSTNGDSMAAGGPPKYDSGATFPSFNTWERPSAVIEDAEGGVAAPAAPTSVGSSVGESGWDAAAAAATAQSWPPAAEDSKAGSATGAGGMNGTTGHYGGTNGHAAAWEAPAAAAGDPEGGAGELEDVVGGGAGSAAAGDADPFGEDELKAADTAAAAGGDPATGYMYSNPAGQAAGADQQGWYSDFSTWSEEQQQAYWQQHYYLNNQYGTYDPAAAGHYDATAAGQYGTYDSAAAGQYGTYDAAAAGQYGTYGSAAAEQYGVYDATAAGQYGTSDAAAAGEVTDASSQSPAGVDAAAAADDSAAAAAGTSVDAQAASEPVHQSEASQQQQPEDAAAAASWDVAASSTQQEQVEQPLEQREQPSMQPEIAPAAEAAAAASTDGWQQPEPQQQPQAQDAAAAAPEIYSGWEQPDELLPTETPEASTTDVAAAAAASDGWVQQQQQQQQQQGPEALAGPAAADPYASWQPQQEASTSWDDPQQQGGQPAAAPEAVSGIAAGLGGYANPPHLTRSDGGYQHLLGVSAPDGAAAATAQQGAPATVPAAAVEASDGAGAAASLADSGYEVGNQGDGLGYLQSAEWLADQPAADANGFDFGMYGQVGEAGASSAAETPTATGRGLFATMPAGSVAAVTASSAFAGTARASTGGLGVRSPGGSSSASAAGPGPGFGHKFTPAATAALPGTQQSLPCAIPSAGSYGKGSTAFAGSTGGAAPAGGSLSSSAGSVRPSLSGAAAAESPHALIIPPPLRSRSINEQLIPSSPHATSGAGFFIPSTGPQQLQSQASVDSNSGAAAAAGGAGSSHTPPRSSSPLARRSSNSRSGSPLGRSGSMRASGPFMPAAAAGAAAGGSGSSGAAAAPPSFWIPGGGSGNSPKVGAASRTSSGFAAIPNGYIPPGGPAMLPGHHHGSSAFGSFDQLAGPALVEGPEGDDADAEGSRSEMVSPVGTSSSWQDPRTATHAYDRLIQERLRKVDWSQHQWQPPGKLGVPQGLQRLTGATKRPGSASGASGGAAEPVEQSFWYQQKLFRKRLEVAPRTATSAPAAIGGLHSPRSNPWQQQQQQQQQQHYSQQSPTYPHYYQQPPQQQQQQVAPYGTSSSRPGSPNRATSAPEPAAAANWAPYSSGTAAGHLQHTQERQGGTPQSKLRMGEQPGSPAAAGASRQDSLSAFEGHTHQQQQEGAAGHCSSQQQYGDQQYNQQYTEQQYTEQRYGHWQQQEQQSQVQQYSEFPARASLDAPDQQQQLFDHLEEKQQYEQQQQQQYNQHWAAQQEGWQHMSYGTAAAAAAAGESSQEWGSAAAAPATASSSGSPTKAAAAVAGDLSGAGQGFTAAGVDVAASGTLPVEPIAVTYPKEWVQLKGALQRLPDDPAVDPAGEYRAGMLMYGDYILANKQLEVISDAADAATSQEEVDDLLEAFAMAELQQMAVRSVLSKAGLSLDALFGLL